MALSPIQINKGQEILNTIIFLKALYHFYSQQLAFKKRERKKGVRPIFAFPLFPYVQTILNIHLLTSFVRGKTHLRQQIIHTREPGNAVKGSY